ncbi:hypothetical protein [Streptomyces sp. NPDC051183]|uniref:hypothetical protein n=1 Tax=Streptomyces sp. NPDC051183 TaxID=3155165 RepID=UPI00342AD835
MALTLSTALPTQATSTGARYLAGPTGRAAPGAEAVAVSQVFCPRGMTVQSGGYSTARRDRDAEGGYRHTLLASHPVFDADGRTGWYASASHTEVTAHVLCRPSDTGD